MKTVFIFILGMLIAIFLLLPDKSNGVSSIDKDLKYEFVEVHLGKNEPKKIDRLVLNFLKKVIVKRASKKEKISAISQTEYDYTDFK